jgi:hypothetical protein
MEVIISTGSNLLYLGIGEYVFVIHHQAQYCSSILYSFNFLDLEFFFFKNNILFK